VILADRPGASIVSRSHSPIGVAVVIGVALRLAVPVRAQAPATWPVHSMERPRPPVVAPPPAGPPVAPPADAIVLFDGTSLARWTRRDGGDARWAVRNGSVEVVRGTGDLVTRDEFGDVQLHLEWATPSPAVGQGQGRGNSGVFLMGHYEIQVLDSYGSDTYADGQAAALYGQRPPLVNASRPPGEWQTYDIVFRRPRFRGNGSLEAPARATVFHNGVLVHDGAAFTGRTVHARPASYQAHGDRLPLALQDHGDPVRYRNIWVRRLEALARPN
jgi:hypothetical protein